MLTLVPLTEAHLAAVVPQPAQAWGPDIHTPAERKWAAERSCPGRALVDGDDVLAVAGMIEVYTGHCIVWAVLSTRAARALTMITRAMAAVLADAPHHRIEMLVPNDFAAGHRWARMLGFVQEGVLRRYGPSAADHAAYARVRG